MSPWVVTLYSFIPMGAALLGGLLASIYTPRPKVTSLLQHFVAGVVVGAVAVELLPKIIGHSSPLTIGIGFLLGVVSMLALEEGAHYIAERRREAKLPLGLLVAGGVDLFVDGLLIGVAFLAGEMSGLVIALSLTLCGFFLTLTLSSTLTRKGVSRTFQLLAVIVLALMFPLGAFIGSTIVGELPPSILIETLAFGVAALLYLGIEELLAEAHQTKDSAWISGAFFFGFLAILLFKL